MAIVIQHSGSIPLLVSFPHSGQFIPEAIEGRMTNHALTLPDTDWYLERLYDFLPELGVSTVAANFSRYLIDPNRSTDGVNLYPGRPTPELCPKLCFDGTAIYRSGMEPDAFDIGQRTATYWTAYHDAIQGELSRLKNQYGKAVLFDSHSIASEVPRLFENQLPDINMGTANGASCGPQLEKSIGSVLDSQSQYSHVFNGRFVGGYITRHYGQPDNGVQAVQLELSKRTYMDEQTGQWDDKKATAVRPLLRKIVESIVDSL